MSGNRAESRPVVIAKAVPDGGMSAPAAPAMPNQTLQMGGGRLPDGGHGATGTMKMNSIFQGGNNNPQLNAVKVMGNRPLPLSAPTGRPVAFAKISMGQEAQGTGVPPAPPAPPGPPTNIEEVLIREGGPEGLTRKEAADLAAVLSQSMGMASKALADGQTCLGVDGAAIDNAKDILAGLQRFSAVGNSDERLSLKASEIGTIESILECAMTYERDEAAKKGKLIAFVAGGLIIGAVVLLATS